MTKPSKFVEKSIEFRSFFFTQNHVFISSTFIQTKINWWKQTAAFNICSTNCDSHIFNRHSSAQLSIQCPNVHVFWSFIKMFELQVNLVLSSLVWCCEYFLDLKSSFRWNERKTGPEPLSFEHFQLYIELSLEIGNKNHAK